MKHRRNTSDVARSQQAGTVVFGKLFSPLLWRIAFRAGDMNKRRKRKEKKIRGAAGEIPYEYVQLARKYREQGHTYRQIAEELSLMLKTEVRPNTVSQWCQQTTRVWR
jgi:hypothetical protein